MFTTDYIGKKCKWKNQICDGLCNNCYANVDTQTISGSINIIRNFSYSMVYPDYEEAILARQEMLDY